ncbi:homeobox protein 9 [Aricia agestis]|uniref:homeobox protein 9 n=1 Tax=Aricia agestis TaxID=91739 RepID=UPI001C205A7D|nr:homeobox protein 9 [Aricia agestis]
MWCFLLFSLFVTVHGRAVNISNTWVLPEEGFPVFYRYFRDRISWYEADAVCQFHHANLVTVDTTAQYDAVRAYLKELDISSAVWVGLIRSNPDGDFTWTDYRGLSGDGYWSSAPDSRSAPLCAAADPASDYRWEARACGGPSVASFICELPVPQWALGNEGCMVRELPALTILYLPESAAVQLTADCGLAGVKRVQCTGNKKREDLLKELSCGVEDQGITTLYSISSATQTTTDTTLTSQEWSSESHSYDFATTEHDEEFNQTISIESTPVFRNSIIYTPSNVTDKHSRNDETSDSISVKKPKYIPEILDNNNLHSNEVPKVFDKNDDLLNNIKENTNSDNDVKHKKLQEELARLGNLDTIFSQTTDHFVPPLVMAKAKLNDDMIALSVEEKIAQQIAEHHFKKNFEDNISPETGEADLNASKQVGNNFNQRPAFDDRLIKSPLVEKLSIERSKNLQKHIIPKKNNKYDDSKGDVPKKMNMKNVKYFKLITSTSNSTDNIEGPRTTSPNTNNGNYTLDDTSMELSIILKEPEQNVKENIKSVTDSFITENQTTKNTLGMNDEVIKIVLFRNGNETDATPTVLDVTTRIPSMDIENPENTYSTLFDNKTEIHFNTSNIFYNYTSSYSDIKDTTAPTSTDSLVTKISNMDATTTTSATETANIQNEQKNKNNFNNSTAIESTTSPSELELTYTTIDIKHDSSNKTERNETLNNTMETTPEFDDFQSPLLSAANEPLHKPSRSRRPQTSQNRANKFNPFRILG